MVDALQHLAALEHVERGIDDYVILSAHHFAPAKLDKDRSDIECR